MEVIRLILESIWLFLTQPYWGPLQALAFAAGALVALLRFIDALIRKDPHSADKLVAGYTGGWNGFRRLYQLSRRPILEKRYLQELRVAEEITKTDVVGKPKGSLTVEAQFVPLRLGWYAPASHCDANGDSLSVDDALAVTPRLMILGEPGAGKTTLAKYVALQMIKKNPEWRPFVRKRFPHDNRFPLPLYLDLAQRGVEAHSHSLTGGPNITPTALRETLTARFSEDELRTLCFDLGFDYESLPGQGKAGKAREIVAHMDRRGDLAQLADYCRGARPDASPRHTPKGAESASLHSGSVSEGSRTKAPDLVSDLAAFRPLRSVCASHDEAVELVGEWLSKGRCMVIVNDLDALLPESRQEVSSNLVAVFQKKYGGRNQVLVTSRTAGYVPQADFKEAEIQPLGPDQIDHFLRNYWVDDNVKREGLSQALDSNPRLAELAQNPLLLGAIAQMYALGVKDPSYRLPERRVALYEDCIQHLLVNWGQITGRRYLYQYGPKEKVQALEEVAHSFQCEGQWLFSERALRRRLALVVVGSAAETQDPDDFWAELRDGSGIFHRRLSATYSFIHSTFQEYLAARRLHRVPPEAAWLREHAALTQWQEVIVLLAGLQQDATPIVSAILADHPDDIPSLLFAARCLRDAVKTPEPVKRAVLNPLIAWITAESDPWRAPYRAGLHDAATLLSDTDWPNLLTPLSDPAMEVRTKAATLLGCLGHDRAVEPLIERLADQSQEVRSTAMLALERIGRPAVRPLIEVLSSPGSSLMRQAAAVVLGKLRDPRACRSLTNALQDPDREIVVAVTHALGYMGAIAVEPLKDCLNHRADEVGEALAAALGMVGKPAVKMVLFALERENAAVQLWATEALCRMGNKVTAELIDALRDPHSFAGVRRGAAQALGCMEDERAIPPLVAALEDLDNSVREVSIEALVRLASLAMPELLQALRHPHELIRLGAVRVLGRIGDPEALPGLKQAVADRRSLAVRAAAVQSLSHFQDDEIVPILVRCLGDRAPVVSQAAVAALAATHRREAIPPLLHALKQKRDWQVRRDIVRGLGELRATDAVEPLVDALRASEWQLKEAAAMALAAIGDCRVLEPLAQTLLDDKVGDVAVEALVTFGSPAVEAVRSYLDHPRLAVQQRTLQVLGRVPAPAAVEAIAPLLDRRDPILRALAAEALGNTGVPDACSHLIHALRDSQDKVRMEAVKAVARLGCTGAADLLVELSKPEADVEWRIRLEVVKAMGCFGGDRAIAVLCAALLGDPAPVVREESARALGRLGDREATAALSLALESGLTTEVRKAAAYALGQIGDPQARQALINAQLDRDAEVQQAAAVALSKLSSK